METPLRQVSVCRESVEAIMIHALTTEKEEVMGLLFGQMHCGEAYVYQVYILQRSDKRKDRVEVSNEQLTKASADAEQIGLRVIGWYHSHPHITIHPSHVDVRTQFMYQYLDKGFFGIILSCFSSDSSTKEEKMSLIAFQALSKDNNSSFDELLIPVIIPERASNPFMKNTSNLEQIQLLQRILASEERTEFNKNIENVLSYLNCSSVYEQSLYRLLEYSGIPFIQILEQKKRSNEQKIALLKAQLGGGT